MGLSASLTAMSNAAFEAFDNLDEAYRSKGEVPESRKCDLGTEWHVLHFMLTGISRQSNDPLGILFDRSPQMKAISEACQAISPSEMQAFQAALKSEDPATLWARFDLERVVSEDVDRVHPANDPKSVFAYALHFVPVLRKFAAKCVKHQCGAIAIIA